MYNDNKILILIISFCCKPLKTDLFQGLISLNNLGGGSDENPFTVAVSLMNRRSRVIDPVATVLQTFLMTGMA